MRKKRNLVSRFRRAHDRAAINAALDFYDEILTIKPKTNMAEERDNRNTGVLFLQEEKENPKWPDFNGSFTDENGKEFWVKGWRHKSQKGHKYISLVFEEKEEKKTTSTKGKKGTDKKVSKDDPW